MELQDDVGDGISIRHRINDENVRNTLQDGGPQFFPSRGRDERMLRAQNNFEVRVELTGQVGYDVHVLPVRMS